MIRAMVVFKKYEHYKEVVARCPNHIEENKNGNSKLTKIIISKQLDTAEAAATRTFFSHNDNAVSRNYCVAVTHQNFCVQHVFRRRWHCSNFLKTEQKN